jgi:hypothetical protein
MALCYNFSRVLNNLGFDRFVAYIAGKAYAAFLAAALRRIQPVTGGAPGTLLHTAHNGQLSAG